MSAAGTPAAPAPAAEAPAKPAASAEPPKPAAPAAKAKPTDAELGERAKLSARARELEERTKALEGELAAAKTAQQALDADAKAWQQFRAQLGAKDKTVAKTLRDNGATFDEIAQWFLTEGEENDLPPEVRETRADVAAIKERLAAEDKAKQEAATAETEKKAKADVEQLRNDVGQILDAELATYPFAAEYREEAIGRAIQAVRDHITANPITETGDAADEAARALFRQAFGQINDGLATEARAEHERLSRLVAPKPDLAYSRASKLTVIERPQPPTRQPGSTTIGRSVRGPLPANQTRTPMSGEPRRLGEPLHKASDA